MASSNTAIPPSRPSETNYTTLRDVSFSSYLNPSEENYIRNLVNTTRNLNNKKVDEEEIDVFSADKYFNGEVDNQGSHIKTTKNEHQFIEKHNEKTVINLSKLILQPRTPSIYSESSSWNSQSGLLRPVQRNPSRSKNNIKVKSNIKSSFLSSCYCCNDKSIEIEFQDRLSSNQGDTSLDINSSFRRESITRTIKTSFDTAEIARLNKLKPVVDPNPNPNPNPNPDPFTFPVSGPVLTSVKCLQIEKENMLSWDSIPKSLVDRTCGTYIDDTESDASSDLFEIECLSYTGNNPNSGYGGCGTPTTRYEPSEVSVDWSVVTASAADYSEDQGSTLTSVTGSGVGPKSSSTVRRVAMTKGGQKSRSGGLLGGCRSQKAVRVAEDVYRSPSDMKSIVQNATRII